MRTVAVAMLCTLLVSTAHGETIWAVRPEPGLVCMTTSQQPAILEQPRAGAQTLANAGPIVFAVTPINVQGGYVEIERPNRQTGWVLQTALTAAPAVCVPTLMSNGLILIGVRKSNG